MSTSGFSRVSQGSGKLIMSIDSRSNVPPKVKTIALDPEVYDLLKRQKRGDETFNDLIARLVRKRRPLADLAGAWKDMPQEDFEKIQEAIRRGRELDQERFRKLMERWE